MVLCARYEKPGARPGSNIASATHQPTVSEFVVFGVVDLVSQPAPVLTENSCQVPGTSLNVASPRSSKPMPDPATRSLTVRETTTSPDPACASRRDARCTAIPLRS